MAKSATPEIDVEEQQKANEKSKLMSSGMLSNFVRYKNGAWNYQEWLGLLASVRDAGYNMLSNDEVGLLLEEEKAKFAPPLNPDSRESHLGIPVATLKSLGALRDGILISVSVFYIAGYLVWSLNAYQNNLGLLPALNSQYLAAGFVPVVILWAAYNGGRQLRRFFYEWWPKKVGKEAQGKWRFVRIFVILLFGGSLLAFFFYRSPTGAIEIPLMALGSLLMASRRMEWSSSRLKQLRGWERVPYIIVAIAVLVFLVSLVAPGINVAIDSTVKRTALALFGDSIRSLRDILNTTLLIGIVFLPPDPIPARWVGLSEQRPDSKLDAFFEWVQRGITKLYFEFFKVFTLLVYFIGLIIFGFIFYLGVLYPGLPQEFGGVKPRCAYLDVTQASLSADTRQVILGVGRIDPGSPVNRSVQLDVYFSSTDLIMVKPHAGQPGTDRTVYAIKQSAIQAVTWCG